MASISKQAKVSLVPPLNVECTCVVDTVSAGQDATRNGLSGKAPQLTRRRWQSSVSNSDAQISKVVGKLTSMTNTAIAYKLQKNRMLDR